MQQVAAEMRHSETAFVRARADGGFRPALVHARGRGRPVRARDARRARTCSSRRAGSPPTPSGTVNTFATFGITIPESAKATYVKFLYGCNFAFLARRYPQYRLCGRLPESPFGCVQTGNHTENLCGWIFPLRKSTVIVHVPAGTTHQRTTFFRLPTVPAAAPVTSSSKGVSPLRALAGLFVWVLLSALGSLAPMPSYAATTCRGDGERACCLGERSFGACTAGLIEASGCTGDCTCRRRQSIGHSFQWPLCPPHPLWWRRPTCLLRG